MYLLCLQVKMQTRISDRSLSGFLLLAGVYVNYLTVYRNLENTGNIK